MPLPISPPPTTPTFVIVMNRHPPLSYPCERPLYSKGGFYRTPRGRGEAETGAGAALQVVFRRYAVRRRVFERLAVEDVLLQPAEAQAFIEPARALPVLRV